MSLRKSDVVGTTASRQRTDRCCRSDADTPIELPSSQHVAGRAARDAFELILSTDSAKTSKPDPRAYALATQALKLERKDVLFVAFDGWDAAGAKWFGYPTFWMNRMNAPAEELGAAPDAVGAGMTALLEFALS